MHASGIAAKCRRNGVWQPKGNAYHSWNLELLEAVIRDVSGPWDTFDGIVKELTEDFCGRLSSMLDGIREDLRRQCL